MNGITAFLPTLTQITQVLSSARVERICELARSTFGMFQGWFLAAMGTREAVVDGVIAGRQIDEPRPLSQEIYQKIHVERIDFSKTHGTLYGVAGGCGVLSGLHYLQYVDVGKALTWIEFLGSAAFIFATIVELQHNIRQMRHAEEIGHQPLRVSAFSGIIRSFSYIVATALSLFGASVTMALVFGCLGTLFGGFKFIFDYLHLDLSKSLT